MSTLRPAVALLAVLAALDGCASVPQPATSLPPVAGRPAGDEELGRIEAAVDAALRKEPPRGYSAIPPGVRLLSLTRRGNSIVLDFNKALLANGTGADLEEAVHQILTAASSARSSPRPPVEDYTVLIDGTPLEIHLR